MFFSYKQIAQYLRCPRSYRHRYLDGWREKETRSAMIFGRRFEKALGAYFCEDDCGAVLHREWGAFHDAPFEYKKGEPGIGCCIGVFIFLSALRRTTVFRSPNQARIFKSRWSGNSRT